MTITFSQSFQLMDKQGVTHTFTLGGTAEQKTEITKTCAQLIKDALGKGWTVQTPTHAASPIASSDPNTTTETIMAEQLIVSADENGTHFKIKGGKYKRFGLPVYPEYLSALNLREDMKTGAHDFKKKVVVQTTKNGGGESSSKVVGLAN